MEYFCVRIDVDRFVLLATTGKNAKNKLLFFAVRHIYPSVINSLLLINCLLLIDFRGV